MIEPPVQVQVQVQVLVLVPSVVRRFPRPSR